MSNQPTPHSPAAPGSPLDFTPVAVRPRSDGWTPERQVGFIQALAATGCVDEAARSVGMSARSARDLRTRGDADSLRAAWEAALVTGIGRLAEAAMSRAIHGTAQPIFFQGEQIGERRRFDERLTQFLLRYHAPERYGAWRDKAVQRRDHPDGAALLFQQALQRLVADCVADQVGRARDARKPLVLEMATDDRDEDEAAEQAEADTRMRELRRQAEWRDFERQLAAERAGWAAEAGVDGSSAIPASSVTGGSSAPPHEGNASSAATRAEVSEVPPDDSDDRALCPYPAVR